MTVDEITVPTDELTTATAPAPAGGRLRRGAAALKSRWRAIVVSILLIASAAVLATVYWTQYRVDRQTGPAAERAAVEAASTATASLLSYAPETIDADLSRAQSLMTGDFSTYYGKFTEDVVAPAVRERGVKARAHVVDAALMEIDPDRARVLVFLNQETLSRDRPEPALTASSVVVTLNKVDDTWRISAFDPV